MPIDPASAERPLALVTGGHRRLGARIAGALAAAGYDLAVHGSHDADPDPFLAESLMRSDVRSEGFVADFDDPSCVPALFTAITDHFGRAPDLLVNSASLFGQDRIDTVEADDLSRHFAVNASAPALLTRAFAAAGGDGRHDRSIVNILDQRLTHPHADQFAYTLSKFALAGLTQLSARALAPRIRVNAVAPGLTMVTSDYDDAQTARLAAEMPLHRLPQPDDVAAAVLFLARSFATTGQVLHVDGGAHMRDYAGDFMSMGKAPK